MTASRNPLKRVADRLKELHGRHAERHRPSGFAFAISDRIGMLNSAAWDGVVAGKSVFMRRNVLGTIEAHPPENLSPRYALICDGDKPVAAIAAQLVDVAAGRVWRGSDESKEKPLTRLLKPAARKVVSRLEERVLVAGNLLSWGFHGIAFAPGEDPASIWPGVAEALYRIRRAEKLVGQTDFAMVKDITSAEGHVEALRRFSYRPMQTEPNMVLQIDAAWRSYEDYLAALDAKYRKNARDQLKKLAAAGCQMERVTDLRPLARRLHDLYLSVQSRASVKLITLPSGFLPALAEAAGDDFRCTAVRRGEAVLGFVTTLRDGDTAIAYYIGFDRAEAAGGVPLYLRLLHATVGFINNVGYSVRHRHRESAPETGY